MKHIAAILVAFLVMSSLLKAQKMNLENGNFSFLKDQQNVNVVYRYDELLVGEDTEYEYVEKMAREFEKDEPGKGKRFKENWKADRINRYHPMFEETFGKAVANKFKLGQFADAEYTLVVNVVFMDLGYNVVVSQKPAFMSMEVKLIDKSKNELAFLNVDKTPGSAGRIGNFDKGSRLMGCYYRSGNKIGAFINKGLSEK